MTDPDDALLTEAVRLADASARAGGAPFAALLVRAETVLGTGVNTVRRDRDPTAHAEVVALRRACRAPRWWPRRSPAPCAWWRRPSPASSA